MVGETDENWRGVRRRRRSTLAPDSVTIYQMELPFNTTISSDLLKGTRPVRRSRSPTGPTKRRWVGDAFEALEAAGYHVRSAYTRSRTRRGRSSSTATGSGTAPTCSAPAWRRSGTSTACTCRTSTRWETYVGGDRDAASCRSAAPTGRRDDERLIRELILQLKRGLDPRPATSADKFGVDVLERASASELASLRSGRVT